MEPVNESVGEPELTETQAAAVDHYRTVAGDFAADIMAASMRRKNQEDRLAKRDFNSPSDVGCRIIALTVLALIALMFIVGIFKAGPKTNPYRDNPSADPDLQRDPDSGYRGY